MLMSRISRFLCLFLSMQITVSCNPDRFHLSELKVESQGSTEFTMKDWLLVRREQVVKGWRTLHVLKSGIVLVEEFKQEKDAKRKEEIAGEFLNVGAEMELLGAELRRLQG